MRHVAGAAQEQVSEQPVCSFFSFLLSASSKSLHNSRLPGYASVRPFLAQLALPPPLSLPRPDGLWHEQQQQQLLHAAVYAAPAPTSASATWLELSAFWLCPLSFASCLIPPSPATSPFSRLFLLVSFPNFAFVVCCLVAHLF